jgi:DNA-binding transcriptional MerR regulator
MPTHLSQKRGPQKPEIPDKLYFRIGDVSKLCGVEPYVLRFWESEFSQLRPNKSGTGQRLYRKRDVEIALRIKHLLYDEGYTIAGARQVVQAEVRRKSGQPELPLQQQQAVEKAELRLHKVQRELREILGLLSGPEPQLSGRVKRTTPAPPPSRPELFER